MGIDADRAMHQIDQLLADGKAQPRTAEAARGRGIDLAEMMEQAALGLGRNADAGVADGKAQLGAVGGRRRPVRRSG